MEMIEKIDFVYQGNIAIITICNPPVNALSVEVRRGLLDALKIPILETWSISSARYDAHSNGECSHLCLPGVPDQWVRVLHAYLLSFKNFANGQ